MDCRACQEVLGIYLETELDGREARAEHPQIAGHLDSCPGSCREVYGWLREGMLHEALEAMALQEAAPASALRAVWSSLLEELTLLVAVGPAQLRSALIPEVQPGLRIGEPGPGERRRSTVLTEVVPGHGGLALTLVWEQEAAKPGRGALRVRLAAPGDEASVELEGVRVELRFDHEIRQTTTDASGQAVFRDLDSRELANRGRGLRLKLGEIRWLPRQG